jgi:hypothetical protein
MRCCRIFAQRGVVRLGLVPIARVGGEDRYAHLGGGEVTAQCPAWLGWLVMRLVSPSSSGWGPSR